MFNLESNAWQPNPKHLLVVSKRFLFMVGKRSMDWSITRLKGSPEAAAHRAAPNSCDAPILVMGIILFVMTAQLHI
jgi:hypothetical protein